MSAYFIGSYSSCSHQRYPTTAPRYPFELLHIWPRPIPDYLGNLVTITSEIVPMLTQSLVRTPIQQVTNCRNSSNKQVLPIVTASQ